MDRKRIVVTGIGVVSPNGIGAESFARACRDGVSGLSPIEGFELAKLRSSVVGKVRNFDPLSAVDSVEARRVPRMVPMAIAAAREAMTQADVEIDGEDVERQRTVGVALGTGGGGLAFVEQQYKEWFLEGKGSLFSITAGTHG